MKKQRIFWNHPMLMDYRKSLFDLMVDNYDVLFFFNKNNLDIKNNYNYILSKNQIINKGVSLQDTKAFFREIKNSDIFITSFIINHFSILGILIASVLRKKIIVWEEMNGKKPGIKEIIKNKFAAIIAKNVDAFFVLGNAQRDTLNLIGVNSSKIFITNEYPGYVYWDNSQNIAPLTDRNIILNMGRIIEVKGVTYLINAFKTIENKYENLYLYIVGEGELKESLIAESKHLEIRNIVFLDHISDIQEKQHLYNNAKMVIVPSIICKQGREGGPLVILEALSAGTPVIASNITGSTGSFIKEGQNGYIAEQKNIHDLAEKIEMLINIIDKKKITKETVKNNFDKIPNHNHQYETLKSAIDYLGQLS